LILPLVVADRGLSIVNGWHKRSARLALSASAGLSEEADPSTAPLPQQLSAGKHDDVADALALVGQILDKMSTPHATPAPKPPKILSMDPNVCNVTLTELFEANERRARRSRFGRF
jgi:hypothetical protein